MTIHNRHSIRLAGYDYSQSGSYFITACTHNRQCLFGEVLDGKMHLNTLGEIVMAEWFRSTEIRGEIELDAFVVMPNHIHGIVVIRRMDDQPGRGDRPGRGDQPVAPTTNGPGKQSIGAFMAGFKSAATKRINQYRQTPGDSIWQRNYYEHIIRNEGELARIRNYIETNPVRWMVDQNHPDSKTSQP